MERSSTRRNEIEFKRPSDRLLAARSMKEYANSHEGTSKNIYRSWSGSEGFRSEDCREALSQWKKSWAKRISLEHDNIVRGGRKSSPLDSLDEFSD
jgi:hypothetical protein